jgi:phosphatidylserine/phosphatidylglycerophosphate/cardiolipin synthase-like enzyme
VAAKKRKKSKNKLNITLILLVGILVMGGYFTLTGNDPLGLFGNIDDFEVPAVEVALTEGAADAAVVPEDVSAPPEQPDAPTVTPPTAVPQVATAGQTDWWEVYFADWENKNDPENYAGTIEEEIIKKIDAAQVSIHIASFEFDLTPVADALVRAHERGVDVRWVTDDEHGIEADEEPGHGQFEMLMDEDIEVKDDGRGALMHNKFWIFDRQILWTGSTNVTVSGIFKQDNNVIVVHSPELAEIYEREFDEMWAGEFGPRSPSTVNQQSVVIEGTEFHALFASEDEVINHLLPYIQNAQSSIRFLAFSFTHDSLGQAMRDRATAGVEVAGVFEKTGSSTQYSELGPMYCLGMAVRRDENPSFLHHKVIIVDDHIVITGSLNFSDNADESNDENVLVVDNADIAALYLQEFDRVWNIASDVEEGKFDCN